MDNYAIEQNHGDELIHWGIKGQKWGVRRYQNKDGSLTARGQKRYNKETEKLKKEKAKVKAAEKVQANKKRTQAKIDKLEAEKKALEDRKKALKEERRGKKDEDAGLSVDERREKALKTSDPNVLYKNRDTLTDNELRERINRINMEQQLAKTAESTKKTGIDRVNKALEWARKGDEVYKFATESSVGKALLKKMGLNEEKIKEFNLDDFYKNMHKMSTKEREAGVKIAQDLNKVKTIKDRFDKDKAEAKKAEEEARKAAEEDAAKAKYQKQVDDYNERWQKDGAADKVTGTETNDRSRSTRNNKDFINTPLLETIDRFEATADDIVGEGTSRRTNDDSRSTRQKPSDYYDPIDSYGEWVSSTPVSNVPAVVSRRGENVVYGLLEDKYR